MILVLRPRASWQAEVMKNLLVLASLLLSVGLLSFVSPAMAGTEAELSDSCSGSDFMSGDWISGNCMNGHCSAWVSSSNLTVSGRCVTASGVTFRATGWTRTDYLSAYCNSGYLSFWDHGTQVSLSGTCSDGRPFSGFLTIPSSFVSGSCRANGPFSVFTSGRGVSYSGSCVGDPQ